MKQWFLPTNQTTQSHEINLQIVSEVYVLDRGKLYALILQYSTIKYCFLQKSSQDLRNKSDPGYRQACDRFLMQAADFAIFVKKLDEQSRGQLSEITNNNNIIYPT